MATFLAGYSGTVTVGATDLNITHWELDLHNGILETTNTSTSGYETYIAGVTGASGRIAAHWDSSKQPTESAPNLVPGQIVTATFKVGTSAKTFSASVIVESLKTTNDVKGSVDYEANVRTTGTITLPS